MKRLTILLVIAATLLASNAFALDLLTNGSFETWDGSNFAGWTKSMGTGTVQTLSQQAADPLNNWGGSPFYAQTAKTFYNHGIATATLTQQVNLAPGTYRLTLQGKIQRACLDTSYVNHPDWGFLTVDFLVDNVNKYTMTYAANNVTETPTFNYIGAVTSNVKVVLSGGCTPLGSAAHNHSFDLSKYDSFTLVPEPGSLLALLAGITGLAGIVTRRKR